MSNTPKPRRGCNHDLTDRLPHPTIQLDVDQLPDRRQEVRSVLRSGGAVILVLGEDWLGVLTREPQLVAGANIALLTDAGHKEALAGLLGAETER